MTLQVIVTTFARDHVVFTLTVLWWLCKMTPALKNHTRVFSAVLGCVSSIKVLMIAEREAEWFLRLRNCSRASPSPFARGRRAQPLNPAAQKAASQRTESDPIVTAQR